MEQPETYLIGTHNFDLPGQKCIMHGFGDVQKTSETRVSCEETPEIARAFPHHLAVDQVVSQEGRTVSLVFGKEMAIRDEFRRQMAVMGWQIRTDRPGCSGLGEWHRKAGGFDFAIVRDGGAPMVDGAACVLIAEDAGNFESARMPSVTAAVRVADFVAARGDEGMPSLAKTLREEFRS